MVTKLKKQIVTKLKNSNSYITPKLKWQQYSKTQIVTKLKTQIWTKLKNSNCDHTQKHKL